MDERDPVVPQREDWKGFLEEFQTESDRAAAIVGAAFLDEQLRYLLEDFLVDHSESEALLDGPLRGFAARAQAAFCLGFLSLREYREIGIIRNVRNRFAHNLHGLIFQDPQITERCRSLKLPDWLSLEFQLTARDRYVLSVHQMANWVALRRLGIRDGRRRIQAQPRYPGHG